VVGSCLPSDQARGNRHEVKYGKFYGYIKKAGFYGEGGQAAEQFAQRGCGVSTLGDIQNPDGYIPE